MVLESGGMWRNEKLFQLETFPQGLEGGKASEFLEWYRDRLIEGEREGTQASR